MSKQGLATKWNNIKRRAYTYKEKKLNQASDFEFFTQTYFQPIDKDTFPTWLVSQGVRARKHDIPIIIKQLNQKRSKQEYDEDMKSEDGLFRSTIEFRDSMMNLVHITNAEAHTLYTNYMHRVMVKANETQITEKTKSEIMIQVVGDFIERWGHYMDTVPQITEKISQIVAQ